MSSRSEQAGVSRWREYSLLLMPLLVFGMSIGTAMAHRVPASLRVCADPNNLPFSDSAGRGFENKIASLIASDFGERLEYEWWPQRRGFVRNTLRAGLCDLVIGVPSSYELTLRTASYYRSSYVFVTRSSGYHVTSFDDTALKHMRVGVHLMGDDYANSPAALALLRRGLGGQIVGYMIYGDYSKPHPPSNLIDAVARGEIDVAVAWGPLAGYFAQRSTVPLTITPVSPRIDLPFTPFVFDIAMGVRRGDSTWRARLDTELVRRRADIQRILNDYGVPLLTPGTQ
jgi:mxaJ protein